MAIAINIIVQPLFIILKRFYECNNNYDFYGCVCVFFLVFTLRANKVLIKPSLVKIFLLTDFTFILQNIYMSDRYILYILSGMSQP